MPGPGTRENNSVALLTHAAKLGPIKNYCIESKSDYIIVIFGRQSDLVNLVFSRDQALE